MTIFICSIDDDEATVQFEYRSKSPSLSYLNITLIILTFRSGTPTAQYQYWRISRYDGMSVSMPTLLVCLKLSFKNYPVREGFNLRQKMLAWQP